MPTRAEGPFRVAHCNFSTVAFSSEREQTKGPQAVEGTKFWPRICRAVQGTKEEASITSITPSEEQPGLDASWEEAMEALLY